MHWTGGVYTPNSVDLEHYHVLVQEDGTLRAGKFPFAANLRKLGGDEQYAHHTGGFNSYRIGLSFCGERDAAHPLTERQIRAGIRATAEMCDLWRLDPLRPDHLCTHMEVWTLLGVAGQHNKTKRDIDVLRFRPELKRDQVGPWLRAEVARLLELYQRPTPPPKVVITDY